MSPDSLWVDSRANHDQLQAQKCDKPSPAAIFRLPQGERQNGVARRDGDILSAVERVGHGRGLPLLAGSEVPEQLAGLAVGGTNYRTDFSASSE